MRAARAVLAALIWLAAGMVSVVIGIGVGFWMGVR